MKTLGQLKTSVYDRGYEDDQAGRVAGFANDVIRELHNDHRWRFAQATTVIGATAGTGPYALPADAQHVESVRLTLNNVQHSDELTAIEPDDMLEHVFSDPTNSAVGGTLAWAQTDEGVLTLWPAPTGGSISVRYQRTPAEVAADLDALPVPDMMYDLVVAGVAQRLAMRERQWDAADRFQAEFDRRLNKVKSQLGLGQRQNAGRVGFSGDKSYR